MTWSLASYTANGGTGFGVLREDGTLVAPPDLKRWGSPLDLLEDWPAAEAVLRELDTQNAPVITYDAPITIHMNGEDVQLIPVPHAHTDGDTMVYFPKADVLMVGDTWGEDVAGARAAGVDVVWIDTHGRGVPEGEPAPRGVVRALPEVASFL